MDSTRIITYIRDGVLADALYEDGRMMELSLISKEKESILGNIYIGKVKNIVKNIQAAFVEIEPGLLCYLPLEDVKHPGLSSSGGKTDTGTGGRTSGTGQPGSGEDQSTFRDNQVQPDRKISGADPWK